MSINLKGRVEIHQVQNSILASDLFENSTEQKIWWISAQEHKIASARRQKKHWSQDILYLLPK